MRRILIIFFLLSSFVSLGYSQNLAIGEWRTHLPYFYGNTVVEVGSLVYCGTRSGLYSYDKNGGDTRTYTKVDGFSGVGVDHLGYNEQTQTLLIAYDDTDIDLLKGNQIINMSQIKDYTISGPKQIYSVTMKGDSAILSCSFGVVILDITNEVVKTDVQFSDDVSFAGVNCYDAAFYNNRYYFATSNGVFSVGATQNIKNLSNWTSLPGIPAGSYNSIVAFGNNLYFNFSNLLTNSLDNQDTTYRYDGNTVQYLDVSNTLTVNHIEVANDKMTILHPAEMRVFNNTGSLIDQITGCFAGSVTAYAGTNNDYWIAAQFGGFYAYRNGACLSFITLDGPLTENTFDMHIAGDADIWVASGGVTQQWNNIFRTDGIFYRTNNDWKAVPIPDFGAGFPHQDILTIAVDPNDPSHIIAGSWGTGFYEVTNYNIATQIAGTPFETSAGALPYKIGGAAIDEDGNYWLSNSGVSNLLKRRNTSGVWSSYSFSSLVGTSALAGGVTVDNQGNIWLAVPGNGIIVLNPDNNYRRLLSSSFNAGDLPNLYIRTMTVDQNGEMWIGCENGIRTFSPSQVVSGGNVNGQKIVIQAEDGNNELLLDETVINDIEVDGANRKWIATQGNGVRLVSEDGRDILLTFTAENSPLLSNNVQTIAIDHTTGEVYFGTEKGIISYRSDATVGTDSFGEVYAFPNPVKHDYTGPIVIKGMANDAFVKITDIQGNLVFETESLGGQAVWDGKRFDGQRPQTGVYLVFAVNQDASETVITKILFIN